VAIQILKNSGKQNQKFKIQISDFFGGLGKHFQGHVTPSPASGNANPPNPPLNTGERVTCLWKWVFRGGSVTRP